MGYKQLPNLNETSAEDVERMRRLNIWLIPVLLFQQGALIFRADTSAFSYYIGVTAWALMIMVEVSILSGWNMRWLSARDNAILNDEWHRAAAGDASRWGLITVAIVGFAAVITERWRPIGGAETIFVLVNGGMLVAGLRYAWLNRGDADGDE